ncbi:MAG: magnesium transporter [Lachnospiraceae bacterium]|nr:magnesium transporter [Lachnospiraceae bacterium]
MEKEILKEPNYVEELVELFRSEPEADKLIERLEDFHENDIAGAFEQLSESERKYLYSILDTEKISGIFAYIEDVDKYLNELDIQNVAEIIENMDSDDAVNVLEEMDDSVQMQLSNLLDEETNADIRLIRSYDDDEIGSRMTTNFILIHKDMTVKEAMKALIQQAEDNDNISTIYVCDEEEKFYGALDLKDLITAREYTELEPLMSTSYPYVNDHEKISECIERIMDYAEDSMPVLNEKKEILGIITAQDVVEVVGDELGDDYAKLAGLTSEEDLEESLLESMKKRMPWLLVLLLLGIGVSTVVGMFENVVSQIALVVCFQSLILDMSGNVGTQSLAVTIRVLMDENLKAGQKFKLVFKEMRVGLCNGLLVGSIAFLFVGVYIAVMKHNTWPYAFMVSGCVGIALIVAMIISSLVGTIVPIFFHKIHIDPAVASGPLITTVNDLVAVVTYYGLAWLMLVRLL